MLFAVVPPLFVLVLVLLLLLAWVGWRWFCRPLNRTSAGCLPADCGGVVNAGATGRAWLFGVAHRVAAAWRVGGDRLHLLAGPRLALLAPIGLPLLTLGMLFLFNPRVATVAPVSTVAGDNEVVSAVLGEAALLPPPVLPPAAFVGEAGADLVSADRDWSKLDPDFLRLVVRLIERLRHRGHVMTLVEGYRSPARQDHLAASGAGLTRAVGLASRHQYGLAVDLLPLIDGRPVFDEQVPGAAAAFRALGEEAEALGLVWGGRWSFRDLGHVEVPGKIQENMTVRAMSLRAAGR